MRTIRKKGRSEAVLKMDAHQVAAALEEIGTLLELKGEKGMFMDLDSDSMFGLRS